MREVMARAEVGDDVYGEDPSVRELEAHVARLLGKEAALFVPSGTMSNQIALRVHTEPGDEVLVAEAAHMSWDESGAGAALAGVQFRELGARGVFTADDVSRGKKPERYYHPRSRLVCIENTHNRSGGRVFPQAQVIAVAERARQHGFGLHLDGARLWNAEVATRRSAGELAEPFDTVSVCFSKGLGAPVGSALCGSAALIGRARRFRKMLGGGMRQAGILAAAALYALEHHRERLALDHEHARIVASALSSVPGFNVEEPETNIVIAHTGVRSAPEFAEALAKKGALAAPFDERTLRFVTHLDVSRKDALATATLIREAGARG
jgi:threonine aldolase